MITYTHGRTIPVLHYQPQVIDIRMHLISILSLVEKPHVSILDTLPHLAGMLMVLATLTILWGTCAFTARMVKLFAPSPATPATPSAATPASHNVLPPVPDGITPEIVAVIAAAAATVIEPNHRVISIKPQSTEWQQAGRQSVLSSHRIR